MNVSLSIWAIICVQLIVVGGNILIARLNRRLESAVRSQRCTRDLIHFLIDHLADTNSESRAELSEFCRTEFRPKVDVMIQDIDSQIKGQSKGDAYKLVRQRFDISWDEASQFVREWKTLSADEKRLRCEDVMWTKLLKERTLAQPLSAS